MINDANVNKRFAFHLTHNDMDALGCALIVNYYYKKKDEEDTKITGIKTNEIQYYFLEINMYSP